ncbi:MAG TPA: TetR/AcrR family transcriptional regulator [Acidimicrobiales bacterium]|nr:TetR/AcrR family transcriptional regulator [Acidimicrobiales bacterium]
MSDHSGPARIDGRRARGERTRLNVLEALLNLVEEGQLRPTAQEVAERAGVALRTVYHHFDDVEALRRQAFDLQVGRNREALRPIDSSLDATERCRLVAHQLRRFHEAVSPIRRAVMVEERSSQSMADALRRVRAMRRQFVEQAVAPETDRQDLATRRTTLDALDVTTSWHSWYYLRTSLGRGAQVAERVLAFQLEQLLEGAAGGASGDYRARTSDQRLAGGERGHQSTSIERGSASTSGERDRYSAAESEEASTTRTMVSGRDRRRRNTSRSRPGR